MTGAGAESRRQWLTASAVVLALLILCGGVAYFFLNDKASVDSASFCNGRLTKEAVSVLSGSEEGELTADLAVYENVDIAEEGDGYADVASRCAIRKAGEDVGEFEVFQAWSFGPWRPEPVDPTWYVQESPIGSGISGWTDDRRAEVWLPDSCSKAFGLQGTPVQVQFELGSDYDTKWTPGDTRRHMGQALMDYARGLAEEKGCDSPDFRLTEKIPGASEFVDMPGEAQCGIPSFVATLPHGPKLQQRVVGDMQGSWSCVISAGSDTEEVMAPVAFAVTTDQRMIDRFDAAHANDTKNFKTELVSCDEHDYLVLFSYVTTKPGDLSENEQDAIALAKRALEPRDELYARFVGSVKRSLNCSL